MSEEVRFGTNNYELSEKVRIGTKFNIGDRCIQEYNSESSKTSEYDLGTSENLVETAMKVSQTPIKLSFVDLDYKVNGGEKGFVDQHHILKKVSGYALPGQTNFIMGASGAGKTTLLNALSGRIRVDSKAELSGKLLLNDCLPVTTETFSRYGAYIMQTDVLFEYFTVQEALQFAARLKLRGTR